MAAMSVVMRFFLSPAIIKKQAQSNAKIVFVLDRE